jgi:NADH:ubiquinone oxidoreductase subunit 2 (subunit N)
MLANYLQHQRRNKMDLFTVLAFIVLGVLVFVSTQLVAILFLLQENKRIGEEIEKNEPPF